MQMHLREALPYAAQHPLVPLDLQIWMQPALHQYARSAKFDRFPDLFVDGVEFKDVAFLGGGSLQGTVKRAEGAILRAEVRVVDVAINDVGDHALGMQFPAYCVRFHTDA